MRRKDHPKARKPLLANFGTQSIQVPSCMQPVVQLVTDAILSGRLGPEAG